jgi:hypothetical protein
MSKSYLLLGVLCLMTIPIAAQKGTKVVKYEYPNYPNYATAVWARGNVVVDVQIDAQGNVISTVAESGHGFLKKPSEDAARRWKFSKSDKNTRQVKLIFVYNIKENKDFKNNYRKSTFKYKFKKPFTLETEVTVYPRIDI